MAALAVFLTALLCAVFFLPGCGNKQSVPESGAGNGSQAGRDGVTVSEFVLRSDDFTDGGGLPSASACGSQGGDNRSPSLAWSGAPKGTTRYAIVVDDEDPPCGRGDGACRHWSVFNIPATVTSLRSGQDILQIAGASEGKNYLGQTGYAGPCPPSSHTYNFTAYALRSGMPGIDTGAAFNRSQFESQYGDFILGSATIRGSFGS